MDFYSLDQSKYFFIRLDVCFKARSQSQHGFYTFIFSDKTLRVVDLERAKTISVHHGTHPIWSVAWNSAKHRVFGGLRNGEIAEFDFRTKEKEPVRILKSSYRTPIHSLQFKNNGLIGAQYMGLSWIPLGNVLMLIILFFLEYHNFNLQFDSRDVPTVLEY